MDAVCTPEGLDALFERAALGSFPTPLTRLSHLSAASGAELWAKRDDLSGEQYGGNHLRKIEYLLADALRKGCRRVLTFSCLGSNYAVAMAIYGQRVGLSCDVVMSYKLPNLALRRNLLLTQYFGARLHYAKTFPGAGLRLGGLLLRSFWEDGTRPYFTRAGASAPIGAMGFVRAGLELARQIRAGVCPMPDRLFVTVSSCGTVAGLLVGFALAGLPIPVTGVRVVDAWMANISHVRWLVTGLLELLRQALPGERIPEHAECMAGFTLSHDYFGAGYGAASPEAVRGVETARLDGLELENTYTGKTFAALQDWAQRNPGKCAVFWNTYNSVDLSGVVAGLDWRDLPEPFWQFFA